MALDLLRALGQTAGDRVHRLSEGLILGVPLVFCHRRRRFREFRPGGDPGGGGENHAGNHRLPLHHPRVLYGTGFTDGGYAV